LIRLCAASSCGVPAKAANTPWDDVPAEGEDVMKKMTEANLKAAFAGESQAHMKYLNFAERAEKEKMPNVARLFHATAYAERVHASNHLRALEGVAGSAVNLGEAIAGETYEVEEMYPAFTAVAALQEEKKALRSMNWALEAEKDHARLYSVAKSAVEGGKDIAAVDIFVCGTCGHTVEGQAPDVCPVCGAKREIFRKF
jgi:rubrerythrin